MVKKVSLIIIGVCLVLIVLMKVAFSGGYKTEIEWAALDSAVFSVENDKFDGDSLEAGTYNFEETTVNKGKVPIVWDIYVSDKLVKKGYNFQENEFKGSVGGLNKQKLKLDLEKGQYIYVVYNKIIGDGTGTLNIKKIK